MRKYVIGRIEGRWINFTPPIQGGHFRPLAGNEDQEDDTGSQTDGDLSSRSNTSVPPSPIFDAVDAKVRKTEGGSSVYTTSAKDTADVQTNPIEAKLSAERASDILKYPSLDYASQDKIIAKYRELDARIKAAGLYDCTYSSYAIEACRYSLLIAGFLVALHYGHYAIAGICLGAVTHQLSFTVHDAGHMGITHNFHVDTCIGIFIADFLGGLSVGWWKWNHNIHHIVTNSPEHDPDIEHMPFFAISTRFFDSLRSTFYEHVMHFDAFSKWMISAQHWLYYPLLLFGRFNLYRLSWMYLILGQGPRKGPAWKYRYLEIAGIIFFWTWYGYGVVYCSIPNNWDRFVFFMLSHMVTMPLHLQITLSHFAMSTADLGVHESFAQKMLRTTMDVDCPTWLDFFHGGLQFQAVHHLFPRIPRHNLRKAQDYVREFCEETNIPYVIYGFGEGNKEVIGRLGEVAKQVKVFEECKKACVKDIAEGRGLDH